MADDPEVPSDDRYRWPIIAHADVEDVDCRGCIWPDVQGDVAEIGCTECGKVVRTRSGWRSSADLRRDRAEPR